MPNLKSVSSSSYCSSGHLGIIMQFSFVAGQVFFFFLLYIIEFVTFAKK